MRIVAGKHRGRVLAQFKGFDVRPTSDRVKESLFQILTPRLAGGSGAWPAARTLRRHNKRKYYFSLLPAN